jgi:phosphoribosylaminoimidazole carboxylase (NCAIR synthetase)
MAALRGRVLQQAERAKAMQAKAEAIERRALRFREGHANAMQEVSAATAALASLESVLEQMARKVNPQAAGVVRSWAGKYGKRGAQGAFLRAQLKAAPEPLSVSELVDAVAVSFSIDISVAILRKKLHESIKRRVLEMFHDEGVLERVVVERPGLPIIRWKWKGEPTLDMLRAQAALIEGAPDDPDPDSS